MNSVLQGITEEAAEMTKSLGAIYAEYRRDYGSNREYIMSASGNVPRSNHALIESTIPLHPHKKENTMNGTKWPWSTCTSGRLGVQREVGRCWHWTKKKKISSKLVMHRVHQSIFLHWFIRPFNPVLLMRNIPQSKRSLRWAAVYWNLLLPKKGLGLVHLGNTSHHRHAIQGQPADEVSASTLSRPSHMEM